MHKSILQVTALMFLGAAAASAQVPSLKDQRQMEGGYEGDFMSVRVILMDPRKGIAAAGVDVGMNGCGGGLAGLGEMTARKLVISPYEKVEGGGACRVTLEFDKSWKQVTATDNGQCTVYHGVSCSWEGQSAKKVRY